MITITVNWFSFILGFVFCILTAIVIGVIGYFKEINGKNRIYKRLVKQQLNKGNK